MQILPTERDKVSDYLLTLSSHNPAMNRIILCFLLSIGVARVAAAQPATARDSLLQCLATAPDANIRIKIYRNLADLYFDKPEEKTYLRGMYRTALSAGNKKAEQNALSDLTSAWIRTDNRDSVLHYMRLLEATDTPEKIVRHLAYLRSRLFEADIRKGNGEMIAQDSLLDHSGVDKNNIYIAFERAFTTGSGLKVLEKYPEALPYLTTAYELSAQLSEEDSYKYRTLSAWAYANTCGYLGDVEESIQVVEQLLHLHENYYGKYLAVERPFYNIATRYIQCYAFLISYMDDGSDEKIAIYQRRMDALLAQTSDPYDKYSGFLATNNRYLHEKDWKNAARTNDSLIHYAYLVAPYNVPGLHQLQAQIYEQEGNYKKALEYEKIYTRMKDSVTSVKTEERLNKLQVEYDVDKLNRENSRLADRNKRILLIALSAFLLLASGACIYLYYNLRRERHTKEMMRRLKVKAEESENMKTTFINSMCHEIRTPLNAIVGFSGVLANDCPDTQSRQEMAELISLNADQLTTSIEHLLHVANLDSSAEPLPCLATDLSALCRQEMQVGRTANPAIRYLLEIPAEPFILSTNEHYLGLVIRNLLNNAAKFTERGTIALGFRHDRSEGRIELYVRDTGCGIPAAQHDAVFERFTKLDTFKEGYGIGLYLCRLIVTRLSGKIYIDPDYSGGTRVVIELPR